VNAFQKRKRADAAIAINARATYRNEYMNEYMNAIAVSSWNGATSFFLKRRRLKM
jgi:hypothetical protein